MALIERETHDEGVSLTIAVDKSSRNDSHDVRQGFGRVERKQKEGAQDRTKLKESSEQRTVPDRLAKIAENRKRGRPAHVVETKGLT